MDQDSLFISLYFNKKRLQKGTSLLQNDINDEVMGLFARHETEMICSALWKN